MFESIARFREKIRAGRLCVGASVTFSDPLVSAALIGSVDFLWVDLEHCLMSPEALSGHLLASHGKGVPSLVRVSGSGTPFLKTVLDAGAEGIIVPQVSSVDEVRNVVRDCRYRPLGRRGYGPRVPSDFGRSGGKDYIEQANRDLFVSVQVETAEALAALDRIVKIPGLDSVVIGPSDLAWALGLKGDLLHPTLWKAIRRVVRAARKAGLSVGAGMGPDADYARQMASCGVQWVQVGGDFSYMIQRADEIAVELRGREVGAIPSLARRDKT